MFLTAGFALLVSLILFAVVLYFAVKKEIKRKAEGLPPSKYLKPEIADVKYMGPVTTEVKRGGFMGAMIGDFLLGPAGLVVGGLAPRGTKTLYRFAVRYDDGKVVMEDCYKNSSRYEVLMRFVNWEDL